MKQCPAKIGDVPVMAWAILGPEVRPTGNTTHSVNGLALGPANGVAIGQATDGGGFYLFYCDSDWNALTDTWHQTVDQAKAQAEFEYEGIHSQWNENAERSGAPGDATPAG
jgi:hypothetical protein